MRNRGWKKFKMERSFLSRNNTLQLEHLDWLAVLGKGKIRVEHEHMWICVNLVNNLATKCWSEKKKPGFFWVECVLRRKERWLALLESGKLSTSAPFHVKVYQWGKSCICGESMAKSCGWFSALFRTDFMAFLANQCRQPLVRVVFGYHFYFSFNELRILYMRLEYRMNYVGCNFSPRWTYKSMVFWRR